ncbi:MAG: flippase-like domain-containing protein [Alloprevotella sp.]|nr:flippase-like domain-containing protein [Alloprevotella sp.]
MRPLYRNLFLLFGIVSIVYMLYKFNVDFSDLKERIATAGLYLPSVIGIWVIVYAFNAGAFYQIVNSGDHDKYLPYKHAYKLTVSGFAFSYTTPFGFGGAPYRVMELSSYIGTPRAMSSTVLYSMMHILSHFFLWATGAIIFAVFHYDLMNGFYWTLLFLFFLIFACVLYFFWYGYRNGLIVKLYRILLYIPVVKKYAQKFYDKNMAAMEQVDQNIAYLNSQPKAFYSALVMEYVGRVINAFEFFFILSALGEHISFADAVIILAFSSLIGNLLFFFPMQLGAREGSLAVIVSLLGIGTHSIGLFSSFYTRVRELFWIIVGIVLVKIGTKHIMK